MKKPSRFTRYVVSLLILFTAMINAKTHAQCTGPNLIQDPEEFQWTFHPADSTNPEPYYSGVMEVGEATVTFNTGETLTTRAYRQQGGNYSIPGPTIKVVPGNKYVLSLHNTLPYAPIDPAHNTFKDPNVVNIHTHGLHISGESPGDDVTRAFEGGFGGDFVWDIPADHMGGTFWYHAHHHGSTYLQVAGGMFGMLIVDDGADGIPASVAAMTERQIICGLLDPSAAGTGGDDIMSGSLAMPWTVNGVINGNICLPPNTWQHWRMLVADPGAMLRDVEFGPECEVMVLARDGVWRTVAPKDLATNTLKLTGASRADFAIRASANSWIKMGGNQIATITVDGTPDPTAHPFDIDGVSPWSANRPSYLRDLRNETNVNNESVSMGARTVNGSKFDHMTPTFTLPPTQVQEWSLSGNVRHPFHLHVYHVQALTDDRDFEAGEYYDVVASQMNVRFDLNAATSTPYDGRTIMHCHVLEHEDQGAMGWLDVDGGQAPPQFPNDGGAAFSEYYSVGGGPVIQIPAAPDNLVANATSSSSIDLSWSDNSSDEDGFDIERSLDGTNFSFLATVGTDVTSYTDNGLSESTTYYYRVTAFNSAGASAASNVANATTQSTSGGSTVMFVQDITVVRETVGKNRFKAVATVAIQDTNGAAVSGAQVDGNFTGPTSSSESGTTDAQGIVSFTSGNTARATDTWCFEVTNVSLSGATYDAASNIENSDCETGASAIVVPGSKSASSETSTVEEEIVDEARFVAVYPNPIKSTAHITFALTAKSHVSVEVYNMYGEKVDVIVDRNFESGQYRLDWNAESMTSGTYYFKLTSGNTVETKRMILAH